MHRHRISQQIIIILTLYVWIDVINIAAFRLRDHICQWKSAVHHPGLENGISFCREVTNRTARFLD